MSVTLRPARPDDAPLILALIRELAEYEKLTAEMQASEADIAKALFQSPARVFCDIAQWAGEPAGFALWFYTYSTFLGRSEIWLEDLFVRPAQRGRGLGKALLRNLARRCVDEGLGRLSWNVLDWNAPAIGFYRGLGAELTDEWKACRLEGDALRALGAGLGLP